MHKYYWWYQPISCQSRDSLAIGGVYITAKIQSLSLSILVEVFQSLLGRSTKSTTLYRMSSSLWDKRWSYFFFSEGKESDLDGQQSFIRLYIGHLLNSEFTSSIENLTNTW